MVITDPSALNPEHPDLQRLRNNKLSGWNWRRRRHDDWTENYTLYRDKVILNRLTQRQFVNLPLMKQQVKTVLKDIDDMPVIYFENLDNDKVAEIYHNEYWKHVVDYNKLDLKDIIDKKQVCLFGRSFTQLNVCDGEITLDIVDPQDVLVDRYCDPSDIDTSRFIIHQHIFKPLTSIIHNPQYDKQEIARLSAFYATDQGLIKQADNAQSLTEKNERMAGMGAQDVNNPVLGETYVEMSLHLEYTYDKDLDDEVIWLYVEAEDMAVLQKIRLESLIGETDDHYWRKHYNYETWADDLERTDFWSDGIADVIRTPNKVLNSFYSQLIENRTLRNFNMHYYDSTAADGEPFAPQSYQPGPWKWFGLPGKPSEVLQTVEVPDLSDSLDEMQFIMTMVEKVSGATSTQQGVQESRQITLGQIQIDLQNARQMTQSMSKFYTPSWKARGYKVMKLMEAAGDKLNDIQIHKKGKDGKDIYSKIIGPTDYRTKSGYQIRVWSQDDKQNQDASTLQRIQAVAAAMPDNPKMQEIYKEKLLEFSNLDPDQINEVMAYEKQKQAMAAQAGLNGMGMNGQMGGGMPTMGGGAPAQLPAGQAKPTIAAQFQQFKQPGMKA